VDRLTTERYGIPSILLMENAANAVARVVIEKLGGSVVDKEVIVLCGMGNNGGDGAAIARLLADAGATVCVEIFGTVAETSGDVRINFDRLSSLPGITVKEMRAELDDYGVSEWIARSDYDYADVVVDALFGTGLTRPLGEFYAEQADILERWRNSHGGRPLIVSVDLPSGLRADASELIGPSFRADVTVTFTAPKAGNVLAGAAGFNGELVIAEIGSPLDLLDEQPSQVYLTESEDVLEWLVASKFTDISYKNTRGHSLVIAGSENYSGAAVLAGNAAMRSGVGLVTVVTPSSSKESVTSRVLPEVMVRGASETENGAISEAAFDEISDLLEKAGSIGIGCGLLQDASTKAFLEKVIESRSQPVIVDADGLNLLSPWQANWPPAHAGGSDIILTPHEGEFMRLLGTDDKDVIKDRVAAVRDFAVKNNVILVLKGERVLIGSTDGRVVVNPTGNSGLGKAGNGDTLAGIVAGFVAQAGRFEIDIFETVVAAVYVAGMAGDIAEKKYGKRVMTASDVRECLTDVFAGLEKN
ncbi:MAG: NAD(P)H-hydrate dehydratase, partial [Pyrinomonadaceae bacterium]